MRRLTVDDVRAYVGEVCFRTGQAGRVGAEAEWHVVDPLHPREHVPLARLRAAVTETRALPAGSRITHEPGGQVELSTLPHPDLVSCHAALRHDVATLGCRLRRAGLALRGGGLDPHRPAHQQVHTARYACMRAFYAARGKPGLAMMCSTASLQVCLDIGVDEADAARRWWLANALGPVLGAAFANSPRAAGRATGLRSTRLAVWNALHHTRPPVGPDPVSAFTRYVLDAPVMLIRNGVDDWLADPGVTFREWLAGDGTPRPPGHDDLVYHLTTLFPPVRPRGWLELRAIDAQHGPLWVVPLAVATALLDDPQAADIAAEAAEPAATCWQQAARDALADPVLARAARACFAAARAALPRLGAGKEIIDLVDCYIERYVARGRCPADDPAAPGDPVDGRESGVDDAWSLPGCHAALDAPAVGAAASLPSLIPPPSR